MVARKKHDVEKSHGERQGYIKLFFKNQNYEKHKRNNKTVSRRLQDEKNRR